MIHGKAPGFPGTFEGKPIWKPSRGFQSVDMRYWALCEQNFALPLSLVDCVTDETTRLEGGDYTIVISDDRQRPDWLRPNINWLPYGDEQYPKLVVFRNMLPATDFPYAIQNVWAADDNECTFDFSFPELPDRGAIDEKGPCAQEIMGDYYPVPSGATNRHLCTAAGKPASMKDNRERTDAWGGAEDCSERIRWRWTMKRIGSFVLKLILFLAIANVSLVNAQAQSGPQLNGKERNVPQEFVVCTGWHALCSASFDCRVIGDKVDCDCMRVNETHIVLTSDIQDPAVKRLTQKNARINIPAKWIRPLYVKPSGPDSIRWITSSMSGYPLFLTVDGAVCWKWSPNPVIKKKMAILVIKIGPFVMALPARKIRTHTIRRGP